MAEALSNKLLGVNKADLTMIATAFGLALLLQPFQQLIGGQRDVEQLGLPPNRGKRHCCHARRRGGRTLGALR